MLKKLILLLLIFIMVTGCTHINPNSQANTDSKDKEKLELSVMELKKVTTELEEVKLELEKANDEVNLLESLINDIYAIEIITGRMFYLLKVKDYDTFNEVYGTELKEDDEVLNLPGTPDGMELPLTMFQKDYAITLGHAHYIAGNQNELEVVYRQYSSEYTLPFVVKFSKEEGKWSLEYLYLAK
jgi:hypothetical protein